MPIFTVIGLWLDDELTIAGVVEGDVKAVDSGPEAGGLQRYCQSFEADSPDEAEVAATLAAEQDDDDWVAYQIANHIPSD